MNKSESPKLAFTVPEACRAIGISRSKFYELVGEGKIHVCKIGSRTVVPRKNLEDFIDGLLQKG